MDTHRSHPLRPDTWHPLETLDELLHVGHAVLEQVPVTADVAGFQRVRCMAVPDVLAEHDHWQAWVFAAQLDGGPEPFVGEGQRHPNVRGAKFGWCPR